MIKKLLNKLFKRKPHHYDNLKNSWKELTDSIEKDYCSRERSVENEDD